MCVNGAYLDLEDGGKGVDGMTTVFPFFFGSVVGGLSICIFVCYIVVILIKFCIFS